MTEVSLSNSAKLDALVLSINTLQGTVSSMKETVDETREDVKDLRKALYGNGDEKAGVMGRLRSLEEWKDSRVWFERLIIGLLASEGLGLAILIIHTLMELSTK